MPYQPKERMVITTVEERDQRMREIEAAVMASGFQDGVNAGLEAAAKVVDDMRVVFLRKAREQRLGREDREATQQLFLLIAQGIRAHIVKDQAPTA